LCEDKLCEDKLCVDKLCEDKLCVSNKLRRRRREEGGGRRAEKAGVQNQKQEPHTKMWGKTDRLPDPYLAC